MAEWHSIEELVRDLGLKVDPGLADEVEKAILRKFSRIHPDKNGGEFSSEANREEWDKCQRALEFVRENRGRERTLATRDTEQELIALLRDLPSRLAKPAPEALRSSCRTELSSDRKARFSVRLRSSGFFALATSALWAFSEGVKNNPIFGPLFQSGFARSFFVLVFVISAAFWLLNWILQRGEQEIADYLLSESNLRDILWYSHIFRDPEDGDPDFEFELDHVVNRLDSFQERHFNIFGDRSLRQSVRRDREVMLRHRRVIPRIILGRLSRPDLEKIAKVIVAGLEAQGGVRKVTENKLIPSYIISGELLRRFWVGEPRWA